MDDLELVEIRIELFIATIPKLGIAEELNQLPTVKVQLTRDLVQFTRRTGGGWR